MRLHHIVFGCALIAAGFAYAAPTSWDRHLALVVLTLVLTLVGLVLATGSKVLDVIHPRRNDRYTQRQLERAFKAGRDSGIGPSQRTIDRWKREGFGYPGPRR